MEDQLVCLAVRKKDMRLTKPDSAILSILTQNCDNT
jgi:hypothetical protein